MLLDIIACYEQKPKPKEFVLPGLVRGTVGSIISPGGAGKSMLALQLAHLIAAGFDPLQLNNGFVNGKVGYLSMEDGADTMHERLHAIGRRMNLERRDICGKNIFAADLTKHGFDLFEKKPITDNKGKFLGFGSDYVFRQPLEEFCEGKTLVFLDTLRSFHTGDENDGGQMSELVGWMRKTAARTNCSIVFLHHTNKSSTSSGDGDIQQASRGSSVLVDNIRWQGFLASMSKDEAKRFGVDPERRGYFVRFGVSKQNYGRPFEEVWFMRGEDGVLEPAKLEILSPLAKTEAKEQVIKGRW